MASPQTISSSRQPGSQTAAIQSTTAPHASATASQRAFIISETYYSGMGWCWPPYGPPAVQGTVGAGLMVPVPV